MAYTKVGIDIGVNEVKCVQIEEKGGIYSIKNSGVFRLSSELGSKGYAKQLRKGIKRFLKKSKIRTASLNFTIPINSTDIIVKVLHIPFVEEKWLDSTIQTELEGSIAEDLSGYVKRWDVLEKDESLGEYTILTVLIKSEITKLLNNMASVTCKVETIEIQPITVGRLINNSSIFVDFGHQSTRLYAFKEGKIVDVQLIRDGGNSILNKIKEFKGLSTSTEEAINILEDVEIQVEEVEVSNINSIVTKDLNNLIEDIKRRIRGIEINHNLTTENIYYSGELSNIEEFESYLSAKLEYHSIPIEFLTDLEGGTETNKFMFAASCILSKEYGYLRGMNFAEKKTIPIDVNFLTISLITIMILTTVGFIDIHKKYDVKISEVESVVNDLMNKSMNLDNEISMRQMEMYSYEEIQNKLHMLEGRKTWVSDMFYIIPEVTPEKVVITEINEVQGKTTIKGNAETYTDIGILSIGLEDYGSVIIDEIRLEPEELANLDGAGVEKKIDQGKKYFTIIVNHNINIFNN